MTSKINTQAFSFVDETKEKTPKLNRRKETLNRDIKLLLSTFGRLSEGQILAFFEYSVELSVVRLCLKKLSEINKIYRLYDFKTHMNYYALTDEEFEDSFEQHIKSTAADIFIGFFDTMKEYVPAYYPEILSFVSEGDDEKDGVFTVRYCPAGDEEGNNLTLVPGVRYIYIMDNSEQATILKQGEFFYLLPEYIPQTFSTKEDTEC